MRRRRRDRPRSPADRGRPRPACPRTACRPPAITRTRRQRRATRSMLCSMMRKVTPRRLISAIVAMIVSSSAGLTPAAGSSSRMISGSAIRMRASSSSLRCPPERMRAGSSREAAERDEVEQRHRLLDVAPLLRGDAAGREPVRQDALAGLLLRREQHVLQHASCRRKGRGIWKVRPRPRRMRAMRRRSSRSAAPSSRICAAARPRGCRRSG